jgi:hypothetical protein
MIFLALVPTLFPATASQAAPSVTAMRFTPLVVPETYALPVTFEATTTGAPASVAFAYNGVDRAMFDNGTNGDRVAGDGVWTIQFLPAEILGKLTPASVNRPFIGFCKPAGGGQFNVFAEVWTSTIGLASVLARSPTVQQTDYVINVVVSVSELQTFDTRVLANRFYLVYPDAYDFLNLVSVLGKVANRFHEQASNGVIGIGQTVYNNTAAFGSGGRLKGVTVFPFPTSFDGATAGFNHEIGHQWMVFANGALWAPAIPHWPKGDVAGNIMGFSIGGTGGEGGQFHYTFTPDGPGGYVVGNSPDSVWTTFNGMELYLMGLIAPVQVGTFFVLNDQTITPVAGQTLTASQVTTFDVNTVIAANGARSPDSTSSQKTFRSATVVYSDQLLDPYAMSLFDWFARRADQTMPVACAEGFQQYTCKPFSLATGGRATLVSTIPGLFTDDPLAAGLTAIRAAHIAELRTRIGNVRQRYNLLPYSYTDPTLAPGSTVIRAQHIVDLRNALADAYTAAGLNLPVYSDPSLGGVLVRAVHVQQLRSALAKIE